MKEQEYVELLRDPTCQQIFFEIAAPKLDLVISQDFQKELFQLAYHEEFRALDEQETRERKKAADPRHVEIPKTKEEIEKADAAELKKVANRMDETIEKIGAENVQTMCEKCRGAFDDMPKEISDKMYGAVKTLHVAATAKIKEKNTRGEEEVENKSPVMTRRERFGQACAILFSNVGVEEKDEDGNEKKHDKKQKTEGEISRMQAWEIVDQDHELLCDSPFREQIFGAQTPRGAVSLLVRESWSLLSAIASALGGVFVKLRDMVLGVKVRAVGVENAKNLCNGIRGSFDRFPYELQGKFTKSLGNILNVVEKIENKGQHKGEQNLDAPVHEHDDGEPLKSVKGEKTEKNKNVAAFVLATMNKIEKEHERRKAVDEVSQ